MTTEQIRVTFQPQGRTVFVLSGTTVLEAAARAGLVVDTPCGGAGTCGKCRVRITEHAPLPSMADRQALAEDALREGWRLACRTAVRQEMIVHIPDSSLFGGEHQIVRTATSGAGPAVCPAIRKVYVQLPTPTLEDDRPDLLRLEGAVGACKADLEMIRQVPRRLRSQAFSGTAVLSDHRLIDFEPGDTTAHCYGVAFDIGTTTLVASLLDLTDGRELAVAARMNPQIAFGDDVLSRIGHATSCQDCTEEMRQVLLHEAVAMIDAVCADARVNREHIYEASFAGNTTMEHLLCGIDPSPLGQLPFVPAHGRGILVPARDLGLPIHHRGMAYVFPLIGGFVGGDTVAGMLATQIDRTEGPVLMIDIGTNGEIVLAHGGQFYAASTAAGPAFEGARIRCGMRGTRAAIEKVVIDDDVHVEVIGNVPPAGICGSGLIDLTAGLLEHGMVSAEGRLLPPDELPAQLPAALRRRVGLDEDGRTVFLLAEKVPGHAAPAVVLTERDVREVQLGTAAIRAGISHLLKRAGLGTADLRSVLIAGGFGSFIRRDKAQRIGLIPADVEHQRIHYVGNVSLAGARWALLSVAARQHGEELARQTRHVELSIDGDFQSEFADAMMFPSMG